MIYNTIILFSILNVIVSVINVRLVRLSKPKKAVTIGSIVYLCSSIAAVFLLYNFLFYFNSIFTLSLFLISLLGILVGLFMSLKKGWLYVICFVACFLSTAAFRIGLFVPYSLLFAIVFAACTIFVLVNSFREKLYYIKATENNASDELLNSENKSNITTDDIKLF